MEADLNLTSNQYSIALVVFFVGYVVFEVPSKCDKPIMDIQLSAQVMTTNCAFSTVLSWLDPDPLFSFRQS